MPFVALLVTIKPLDQPGKLTISDCEYVHAALFHALTTVDAAVAHSLHDMKRNKQLSLAIVASHERESQLRITFVEAENTCWATTFVNALAGQLLLRLGKHMYVVVSVELAHPRWSGISTWEDFLAEAGGPLMRFSFVTPTAITKRDRDGTRFSSVYPDPRDVFVGLARKWSSYAGPHLPLDLEDFIVGGGCVVANYQLHTIEFKTSERTQLGFVGHAVYQCRRPDTTYLAALNALTRFAFFTGVGYQTARGMGVVHTTVAP